MTTAIFHSNNKFTEFTYTYEKDFGEAITNNSKLLFGVSTIYIDLKAKIDAKSLGGTIPDGLLFDLKDIDNAEFYLVEVELAKHDFYKHIFPQITKFFAFFKNPKSQNELIGKIYEVIQSDKDFEKEFKKYLAGKEIFKFIKDTIENSQNILLILDDPKPELPEIIHTYAETWGKMVQVLIFKEYRHKDDEILSLTPDFESIKLGELPGVKPEGEVTYTEEWHLDGVDSKVKKIYQIIKSSMLEFKPSLRFNPQKYYISIIDKKNFAYIDVYKKKITIVIMLKEDIVRPALKYHKVVSLSEGVRRFYGGPCCRIIIEDDSNLDEVIDVLKIPVTKNIHQS